MHAAIRLKGEKRRFAQALKLKWTNWPDGSVQTGQLCPVKTGSGAEDYEVGPF